ncbi:MAG: thiol-activated cytolysin family protein [Flavobacteriaceae bacterium]
MKLINYSKKVLMTGLLTILLISCSKEDDGSPTSADAQDITAYIQGLNYDPNQLLNVQETEGAPSLRTLTNESSDYSPPNQGTIIGCQIRDYDLFSNFDDVAILRPTNGVIYPGALVVGNQEMLDGAPSPLSLERAPMTLRLDLPGIGSNGNIDVNNPNNSEVNSKLDEALEWWNDNAYQQGYVNASNSSYQAATSYSSTQLSMDIGLNVAWASGDFASQLDYETNTERRVASIAFKQVFYTVTMNTPSSSGSVFGSAVSLTDVQSVLNSQTPPAYVSSVSYGRILMLRMETTNMDTSIDLRAVLEYSSGVNSGSGDVNVTFDEILQNSSMSLVTIGGNAEVALSSINTANIEDGPGSLNQVITGENAVYSRNNPGVPIAYTIRYLKDNSLAKMGYTTDYRVEECGSFPYQHQEITVTNDCYHDTRFRFRYKGQDTNNNYNSQYYELDQGDVVNVTPPSGAHDVKVRMEWQCGSGGFNFLNEYDLGYVSTEKCYIFTGGSFCVNGNTGVPSVSPTSCN